MAMIHLRKLLMLIAGALLLALLAPSSSLASEAATTTVETTPAPEATSSTPAPQPTPSTTTAAPTSEAAPAPAPVEPAATTPVPSTPQVSAQSAQGSSSASAPSAGKHTHSHVHANGSNEADGSTGEGSRKAPHRGKRAPKPSALTPALPLSLSSSISGVPAFFIESFRIPPFLLPIYQAAGSAYGVPWQILAAINEVETDYGRDLSVSSAGAEGWMQFLPSSWATYAVDANGDGFKDPYNPADAIFTAARYLRAAGAATNVRGAILAYNHSQAYVESVMLRAKLLGGTPSGLLGAITGLTESRFPVHARSHFSDGFPTVPDEDGSGSKSLAGTTIYSEANAPVIAVQDGQVVALGDSPQLGHFISLRDAYGNTYTYAQLGDVAQLYPVLEPHDAGHTGEANGVGAKEQSEPRPTTPASAGTQLDAAPPPEEGASVSALSLGSDGVLSSAAPGSGAPAGSPSDSPTTSPSAAATGEGEAGETPGGSASAESTTPATTTGTSEGSVGTPDAAPGAVATPQIAPAPAAPDSTAPDAGEQAAPPSSATPREFRDGPNDVYLHALHAGVRVIAGTVLGHVDESGSAGAGDEPHILFQIRPAGVGAPLIDPKPILDGWVALENSSIFRAKGDSPFADGAPSAGQVLLESKEQLQRQVLSNGAIEIYPCGRQDIETGQIDRRVLATLEFLAVSDLDPTVSALKCGHSEDTTEGNVSEHFTGDAVDISEINGTPIDGHQGPGSITDTTIRKLLTLQGSMKPHQIISLMSYPGADNTLAKADHYNHIHVGFAPDTAQSASVGGSLSSSITPGEWIKLISRLGEIPDPSVASGPSSAAIPDQAQTAGAH
jgi:soluble lytic murein transglycosylase-like protein